MKKYIACLLALLCVAVLMVACGKETGYQPTEVENVTMQILDVSATGATVVIKDTNEEPYMYGSWYKIERETDGKWTEVKTVIDNYGFDLVGYLPDINGEVKFDVNWEWLYGQLPPGNYRIVKEVNSQNISVEFRVEA